MTIKDDAFWMMKAIALAKQAGEQDEVPIGAVIVKNEEIIGQGFNQPISTHDPSAHAEIVALRHAGQRERNYRIVNATMYVTVEPCTMCLGALMHARITKVVFGATEPKAGVFTSNLQLIESDIYNHKIDWVGGVLQEECAELMQMFFKYKRNKKKQLSN